MSAVAAQGTIDLGIALSQQAQGQSEGGGVVVFKNLWALYLWGAVMAGCVCLGFWCAPETAALQCWLQCGACKRAATATFLFVLSLALLRVTSHSASGSLCQLI